MIRPALLLAILLPAVAAAQVSVNQGALDQLKPSAAPATTAKPAPATASHARPTHPEHHPTAARPGHPPPAAAPAPAKPKPKPVTIAPNPPPAAVVPPPVEAPHPAPLPPPPVPVLPDAQGTATPIPGGVRISFGAGKSDLNPATDAALIAIAGQIKAEPDASLNLFSYAAGMPDDPSTPRRLSLSRALAARAVLISEGIVSTRIYVRALGATPSDGPPDRVDIVRVGTPAPATGTPAAAAKP